MDGRSLVKEVIDMPNEHLPEQNHLLAAFSAGTQDRLYPHLSPDPDGLLVVGKILNLRSSKLKGIVPAMKTVRVGLLNVNLVVVLLWDIRVYGTASSTEGKPLQDVQVTAGRQTRRRKLRRV